MPSLGSDLYVYVVNDLGVDLTGQGKSSQPVDEVVATIRSNGGTAVPNYGEIISNYNYSVVTVVHCCN